MRYCIDDTSGTGMEWNAVVHIVASAGDLKAYGSSMCLCVARRRKVFTDACQERDKLHVDERTKRVTASQKRSC